MIYFISDTHFNHNNIIKFCNRPFNDVLEMNEVLIDNWNKVVKPTDNIYHLGDVGFGHINHILERLNGKKYLITGSHDKNVHLIKKYFIGIDNMKVIKEKIPITLCHYAMRTWYHSHFNTWHLYGHSHGNLEGLGKSFDVSVENILYKPISLLEIQKIMESKPNNFNFIKNIY